MKKPGRRAANSRLVSDSEQDHGATANAPPRRFGPAPEGVGMVTQSLPVGAWYDRRSHVHMLPIGSGENVRVYEKTRVP